MKKNLVMAAARGYNFYELEPFLQSFKKNCTSADCVLFVDELSDFTADRIKNFAENIFVEKIPDNLKEKLIIDSRWTMYKNFLEKNPSYEKIFLTDIADVIFQADIFEKFSAQKNFLVYAAEGIKIDEDPLYCNQQWIKHLFGEEEFQKLKNNFAICCGTVLGSCDEIKILIDAMIEILKHSTAWGDEQAAMNYLVHNKILSIKNLIESDVESGEILTCSILKDYKVEAEKILRGDGKIPAVVHQYHKKPELMYFVSEVYHEKIFEPNKNFSDFKSQLDEVFSLVNVLNWQEATKIFVGNLLYDAEIKNCAEKILKLYNLILNKVEPQNFNGEILLAAVQKILSNMFDDKTLDRELFENLLQSFEFCKKNFHTVNAEFKFFLGNTIQKFVDIFLADENKVDSLKYMEFFTKLNLPLSESFYLQLAKLYREVGDKEKALATYQKALKI